jgi:hypothetical protein
VKRVDRDLVLRGQRPASHQWACLADPEACWPARDSVAHPDERPSDRRRQAILQARHIIPSAIIRSEYMASVFVGTAPDMVVPGDPFCPASRRPAPVVKTPEDPSMLLGWC